MIFREISGSFKGVKKEYLYDMVKTAKKRAAIYARVSTLDKGQNPETQLIQLREYVQKLKPG